MVAVLLSAGDQTPVIPLLEMLGKLASIFPEQIGATEVKTGVTGVLIVIVNVVPMAHCPVFGVNA